jgi:hypothetical protein
MEIHLPTQRLPSGKLPLSLLLAALSAAVAATLLSPHLIAPEPRSMSMPIAPAKRVAPTRAVSGSRAPRADPNHTKSVQKPDERKAVLLYLLHGFADHPLGIFK